jgi:hypothetical protein
MSYDPGTKLSSFATGFHATVLTDGKVMMTHGLGAGQIVKLEDWLILAGDVIDIFCKDQPQSQPQAQVEVQAQPQVEAEVQAQENVPIGSKFRWDLNGNTYRVAIMTSKGVLQVKSVTDGVTDEDSIGRIKRTMFPNEAAWRASLPEGDAVTPLTGPDTRSQIQKRLDAPLQSHGDAEKIGEFMDRFKIRSDVIISTSPNKLVEILLDRVEFYRKELNKITLEEELAGCKRHSNNIGLKRALRSYGHCKYRASIAAKPDVGTPYLYVHGGNRLRTNIGGTEYEVGLKGDRLNATQIAIRLVSSKQSPAILYNSLAELGNPKIYMIYRRKRVELPL